MNRWFSILRVYGQITKHKFWVSWYLSKFIMNLIWRSIIHDLSKFKLDEAEGFARNLKKFKHTEYGTQAYRDLFKDIQPSVQAHYARNRHHPEHWLNGYQDMNVADLIEMICDWTAASKRVKDGDVEKSMHLNKDRFNISGRDMILLQGILNDIL